MRSADHGSYTFFAMTPYLTGATVSSSLLKGLASVCETTRAPSMVMRAAVAAAFVVVLAVCETIVAAALAMHPAAMSLGYKAPNRA